MHHVRSAGLTALALVALAVAALAIAWMCLAAPRAPSLPARHRPLCP